MRKWKQMESRFTESGIFVLGVPCWRAKSSCSYSMMFILQQSHSLLPTICKFCNNITEGSCIYRATEKVCLEYPSLLNLLHNNDIQPVNAWSQVGESPSVKSSLQLLNGMTITQQYVTSLLEWVDPPLIPSGSNVPQFERKRQHTLSHCYAISG